MTEYEGNPVESIGKFLFLTHDDLNIIMLEFPHFIRLEFREYAIAAWREAQGSVEQAHRELRMMWAEDRERLIGALEGVGLTGMQLAFKFKGFTDSHVAFLNSLEMRRPRRAIIRRLLSWINIILGSLVLVLPILELLKEFKEALEQSLAWKIQ